MEILNASAGDIDTIFDLYEKAIEFQKTKFDKHWLGFDAAPVNKEIAEKRLWKIVIEGETACIFSVAYSDPMIWGEKSADDPAMYIHRIVTNPNFRGRGFVTSITKWSKEHARSKGLRYVRMDTWGDNQKLIDYYQANGFKFLGLTTPEISDALPKQYHGISLGLFEIDIGEF